MSEQAGARGGGLGDREPATILVVDDSAFLRRKFTSILNEAGYRTEAAADGEEACVRYRQVRPALVLMNVTLPGVDGVTVTRWIRAADPGARVVLVTALKAEAVLRGAIQAGVTAFLSRPVDPGLLVSVVRSLVPPGGALAGATTSVPRAGRPVIAISTTASITSGWDGARRRPRRS